MIVGIDLGTTNSLVAVFTEEGPVIIPNRLGKHLTPSVVSVDENGNVYVGETAQERRNLYPDSVAQAFKRSMGTDRTYDLSGKKFRPEELSSMILRYLKEDAEAYLGEEVTEAVISVPAYFDDKRRKATKRAGELAGLKVERMISEPTAAAVAYGLYEKEKDTRFLVFDLGGGTFDVSILELYHNILEVRAVAGDNYLGGEDFTEVMSKLFLQKTGLHYKDLSEKEQVRLYKKAEEAKRGISDQTAVTMELMLGEENKTAEITLKEYEEECDTVIPASHTERLYTVRDNQDKVRVRVLQGESRFARNNLFLGELNIDVPKGSRGSEAVDVTYTYDINSLLEVEVKVVSTGLTQKMIIKGQDNQMTDDEIQKRMEELSYLKIQPRDLEENRLVLLRAERMYEEALGDRRKELDRYITVFEAALKKGKKEEIEEAREALNEILEDEDE